MARYSRIEDDRDADELAVSSSCADSPSSAGMCAARSRAGGAGVALPAPAGAAGGLPAEGLPAEGLAAAGMALPGSLDSLMAETLDKIYT